MNIHNGLMNDTKWNEIRNAMYNLKSIIKWRTKIVGSGYISSWDAEWFYHFRDGGYDDIEWLEISLENESRNEIIQELHSIHVPGMVEEKSVKIYGYYEGFIEYV